MVGRALAATVLLALAVATLGCTWRVKLVGDYDSVLDQSVMQLQTRTNEFYALYEKESDAPSESDIRVFFAGSFGAIEAMITRATVLEDGLSRTPLTKNLGMLKEQFEDVRRHDEEMRGKPQGAIGEGLRSRPYRVSSLKALNAAFKALQVQLVYMKKTQSQRPDSQ